MTKIKSLVSSGVKKISKIMYQKVLPKISEKIYDSYKTKEISEIEINNYKDGYFFVRKEIPEEPIVYSVGIGDNINYGISMIKKCNANVFGFDPTEQSKNFVEKEGIPEKYSFFNYAISEEGGLKKMYHLKSPSKNYLAGTVLGVGEDSKGKEKIRSRRLKDAMIGLGHNRIDMLKIDAEGAEYGILKSMIEDGISPKQIAVEFHPHILNYDSGRGMLSLHGWKKTASAIDRLKESGYLLCYRSRGTEFLFVQQQVLE